MIHWSTKHGLINNNIKKTIANSLANNAQLYFTNEHRVKDVSIHCHIHFYKLRSLHNVELKLEAKYWHFAVEMRSTSRRLAAEARGTLPAARQDRLGP